MQAAGLRCLELQIAVAFLRPANPRVSRDAGFSESPVTQEKPRQGGSRTVMMYGQTGSGNHNSNNNNNETTNTNNDTTTNNKKNNDI